MGLSKIASEETLAWYRAAELKHSRVAMAAATGWAYVASGGPLFPGYISPTAGLKFADVPSGMIASLESMPTFGWLQIMLFCCMQETGAGGESSFFALAKYEGYGAVGDREAGDIANIGWVRYDDPETKAFKLNAERQNGRAAMLGITGCLIHELLGVDPLYPTGGLDGGAPPTIF